MVWQRHRRSWVEGGHGKGEGKEKMGKGLGEASDRQSELGEEERIWVWWLEDRGCSAKKQIWGKKEVDQGENKKRKAVGV